MTEENKGILETAKERYKLAEEAWSENREEALDDMRFARLAEQWPEEIRKQRELDGRPCLTINRLPAFIRQVVNDARMNTPAIKVHPVDDNADVDTAEVMSGIIRNIEKTSNADVAYDSALEDAVTCGFGYFRINIDYAHDDAFEMDIEIERIANPVSVYFDPYSVAVDASDWAWCFVTETLSKDEFAESYPDAEKSNWEGEDESGWITEDTVRVAEYWVREEIEVTLLLLSDGTVIHQDKYEENQGVFDAQMLTIAETRESKSYKVTQHILTGAEILETVEWPGRLIPIIPVFGDEVMVEDKRYFMSLIRQSKDAQRNYNYWRTTATESVALSPKVPFIGPVGAFDTDSDKWSTANTETHAHIEYDGSIAPQRQPFAGVPAGALQESLNASDDLKSIMGIHDASLGARSNETSGRAIMARQREGDVSTFHFIDNLSRGIQYAGKVLIDLIPYIYDKARVIRIMGADGEPENIQINQEFDVNGIPKHHDLTKGKYDLVVNAGPSFTSQREEAATQMVDLLRAFPAAAPIIGDLVAKNLDWPGADEIAKRLKTLLPPQIQAMEKMDGLPPEAQSAIAQAQQQVTQLTQVIQQGKGMLMEKDKQIEGLELEKKWNGDDLQQKDADSKRKYDANMAKIDADLVIQDQRAKQETQITVLEGLIDSMQEQAAVQSAQTEERFEQQANKAISISAPSGETYNAVVADGQITIDAPSGKTYTGKISQEIH